MPSGKEKEEAGASQEEPSSSSPSSETITLTATCLCKTHTFTTSIPLPSLPLPATYCHCTSCRHLTGALYSSYVPWPESKSSIRSSSLRRYKFARGSITTLFCGTCGTAVFAETLPPDSERDGVPRYGAQTGVLANVDLGSPLVEIVDHLFVGDTRDGGAVPWLCDGDGNGSRPRVWRTDKLGEELGSDVTALARGDWPVNTETPEAAGDGDEEEEIPIRCHCGGVDLVLRRPTADFAAMPRSELPWFVDPVSNKSLGGFDACDSCRLSSGSDVFHWTFVLLRHLGFPSPSNGKTDFPSSSIELKKAVEKNTSSSEEKEKEDRDPRWGTLTFYSSSPDVQRYFCSRCSACVFYASDDRPEMVDLAIGLLDTKSGARAESLVSWDFGGKMVWRQDVAGGWRESFIENIETAAERWRIERDYPKNWRRIQKEAKPQVHE